MIRLTGAVIHANTEKHQCMTVSHPTQIYYTSETDKFVATHNSPATQYCITQASYTLSKASSLLVEPLMGIIEQSPFFEKVRTHDEVVQLAKEDRNMEKIYYTTATRSSVMSFTNGLNLKIMSDIKGLTGQAQPLTSKIKMADSSFKDMCDIKVGDEVAVGGKVTGIFPQGRKPVLQLNLADGRKAECTKDHLWTVWMPKSSKYIVLNTEKLRMFMSTGIEFYLPDEEDLIKDKQLILDAERRWAEEA